VVAKHQRDGFAAASTGAMSVGPYIWAGIITDDFAMHVERKREEYKRITPLKSGDDTRVS